MHRVAAATLVAAMTVTSACAATTHRHTIHPDVTRHRASATQPPSTMPTVLTDTTRAANVLVASYRRIGAFPTHLIDTPLAASFHLKGGDVVEGYGLHGTPTRPRFDVCVESPAGAWALYQGTPTSGHVTGAGSAGTTPCVPNGGTGRPPKHPHTLAALAAQAGLRLTQRRFEGDPLPTVNQMLNGWSPVSPLLVTGTRVAGYTVDRRGRFTVCVADTAGRWARYDSQTRTVVRGTAGTGGAVCPPPPSHRNSRGTGGSRLG